MWGSHPLSTHTGQAEQETNAREKLDRTTNWSKQRMQKTGSIQVTDIDREENYDQYCDAYEDRLMKERRRHVRLRRLRLDEAPIQSRIFTPNNYRESLRCDEAELWKQAIRKEIEGLMTLGVFEAVKPVKGKRSIDSKLVFKVKYHPDGSVDKYKARYVIRGDRQRKGIDYDQIFAPVAHHTIARTLLSVACALEMEIHLVDITQAFLYADLEEDVYMRPADGVCEVMGLESDTWLKLKKSLYGLRQAPRNWNLEFNSWLKGQGFKRCGEDDCLYTRNETVNGKDVVLMILEYVDDFIMVCNDLDSLEEFKAEMMKKYKHDNGGDIKYYLGVEIERDRKEKTLSLHQTKYTLDLIEGIEAEVKVKEYDTPLTPGIRMLKHTGAPVDQSRYRSVIGTLIYLQGWTRMDVTYAVSELASHVSNPGPEHHDQLLHLIGYLKRTCGKKIVYRADLEGTIYRRNIVQGFCDASFASDKDTWRSRTGFVMFLNGGPISWKSKPQAIVALSSTDAEIEAAVRAVREVLSLRVQLYQMGLLQNEATVVFEDNAATISISMNASLREATKHLGYRRGFLRDHHEKKHVVLTPIPTSEQTADIFTKSLARVLFERHRDEMLH